MYPIKALINMKKTTDLFGANDTFLIKVNENPSIYKIELIRKNFELSIYVSSSFTRLKKYLGLSKISSKTIR